MARDRKTIKKEMTDAFLANASMISLYNFTPGKTFEEEFSEVSLEAILFNIVSYAIFFHEQIVSKNAENSRPHNIPWYQEQAYAFLDGLALVWMDGQFKYNTTGVLNVAERKIIKRCAVIESNDGDLVLKVATQNGTLTEPLTAPQLERFKNYMQHMKDAGNRLRFINQPADLLKITLNVYVDIAVIDLVTGKLLNTTEEVYPIKDAIYNYLANLEFNGAFVKEFLKNEIQLAQGVKLSLIESLEWKYAAFPFVPVGEFKIAEAGYFSILPENLTINYIRYDLAPD